jgi:hypothetical protein
MRVTRDNQRIAELDFAVFSFCNFEGRADWGTLRDIPVAADGTFAVNSEVLLRSPETRYAVGLVDVDGRLGASRLSGTIRFQTAAPDASGHFDPDPDAKHCDSFGVEWSATPAFVGRTSQGTPVVARLGRANTAVSRLGLAWVPKCRGGDGLYPPQNLLGVDEHRLWKFTNHRFTNLSSATAFSDYGEVKITRQQIDGRIGSGGVSGTFHAHSHNGNGYGTCDTEVSFRARG